MNTQIEIVDPKAPELQTLYGLSEDQKKMVVGATAGILAGIVLFVLIRKMRKG